MFGQLLELIILACVAFFIINKLMATLGNVSEEDQARNKSFFENSRHLGMQDVTNTMKKKASIFRPKFFKAKKLNIKGLVVQSAEQEVVKGLTEVLAKLPNFDLYKFLKGAKSAFKIIIKSGLGDDKLAELVDKRYIDHFKSILASYGGPKKEEVIPSAHVSEVYMFGNNIFIKVLFTGKNITNDIKDMHEEWTFTKSTLHISPNWYLTNIDRPQ